MPVYYFISNFKIYMLLLNYRIVFPYLFENNDNNINSIKRK